MVLTILTEEQKAIVESPLEHDIRVNACPGSGKTFVIKHRVLHLIKMGVSPGRIAVFTFTRALGAILKESMGERERLGWAGTVHKFCYMNHGTKELLTVYENPSLQSLFDYVIFDEYQDADESIAKFITYISANSRLMIVGDENQQLYIFRGAEALHLIEIRPFKVFKLTRSFRCSVSICRALSAIIQQEIISEHGTEGTVGLYRTNGPSMSHPFIISEIYALIKKSKAELGAKTFCVISPIMNTRDLKTERFINDIKNNISGISDVSIEYKTVHKTKGLEYDVVFLVNAIDAPFYFDMSSQDGGFKFFVACSRARYGLYIFEHFFYKGQGSISCTQDGVSFPVQYQEHPYIDRGIQKLSNKENPMKYEESIHPLDLPPMLPSAQLKILLFYFKGGWLLMPERILISQRGWQALKKGEGKEFFPQVEEVINTKSNTEFKLKFHIREKLYFLTVLDSYIASDYSARLCNDKFAECCKSIHKLNASHSLTTETISLLVKIGRFYEFATLCYDSTPDYSHGDYQKILNFLEGPFVKEMSFCDGSLLYKGIPLSFDAMTETNIKCRLKECGSCIFFKNKEFVICRRLESN